MENKLITIGACVLIAVGIIIVLWAVISEYRLNRWIRKHVVDVVKETKRTIKL